MASRREDKRAEKEQKKKNKGPGMFAQMKQVFAMTRKSDPNLVWIMLMWALLVLLLFIIIGVLTSNWITWTLIGIPFAVMAAVFVLSRRAEKAAFNQIEGQPGAAGAALSSLRRGWIVEEQPVAINPRTQDLVFRALGRPGIVLVTEGHSNRVGSLIAQEKKRLKRVVPNVPVHVIKSGNGEDQTPLKNITQKMRKLPNTLTQQEVHAINARLVSLGNNLMPMPKGIDPNRMRPDRKAMRG
ncbi:DUF4191 domain-containing protein [uncultured Rothia sp.]|uniref:DUF4191 domain-containing protein n=1 Tax=uncultured Rothia sp. TaxID=316088 RepID=UPI003217B8FE